MKLTNKQQIEVLETVLEMLSDYDCSAIGLCCAINKSLLQNGYPYPYSITYASLLIPLFTRENAMQFGANEHSSFWWELDDRKSRIEFTKWMIEQLKNNDNEANE